LLTHSHKTRGTGSNISNKRASPWGALFVCVATFFIARAADASEPICAADHVDEVAVVTQVIDGDTVRLQGGRSVRLIGINTSEIGRDGKPSEPLAEQARETLRSLLGPHATVSLRYGQEQHDRYGRLLAHLYLSDGQNVEAYLLKVGLAAQITVPPNSWRAACYRAAEQIARAANKGVWREYYRPLAVEAVPADARGFRVITGKVIRVGQSKRSWWLNFAPRPRPGEAAKMMSVRISIDDLPNFDANALRALTGKKIIVRGWLHPYKNQPVMRLRHPANLEVVKAN